MVLLLFATFDSFNNCKTELLKYTFVTFFLLQNKQVEKENIAHPKNRKKSKSIDEVQNFD
jgi:hypothetical protein